MFWFGDLVFGCEFLMVAVGRVGSRTEKYVQFQENLPALWARGPLIQLRFNLKVRPRCLPCRRMILWCVTIRHVEIPG